MILDQTLIRVCVKSFHLKFQIICKYAPKYLVLSIFRLRLQKTTNYIKEVIIKKKKINIEMNH